MAWILRQWGTIAATAIAAVLIGGAYIAARGGLFPDQAYASSTDALLQAVATKDSDGDGLPDWEESLYGTNPHAFDTRGLGMSDGEAVAKGLIVPIAPTLSATEPAATTTIDQINAAGSGSLTEAFSRNFFTLYLSKKQAGGGSLSQSDMADLVSQAVDSLTSGIADGPDFKTAADIKVSGSGTAALKAYAAAADEVARAHTIQTDKSELLYLQDAVQNNDTQALKKIKDIATAYHDIAAGLAQLSVPQEAAAAHLKVVNAFAHMSDVTRALSVVNTDPIAALLALKLYPSDVESLAKAFIAVSQTYQQAGVTFAPGEAGSAYVRVISDVEAAQASSTTPH